MHSRKKFILDIFGHEPATLDELGDCVRAVIDHSGLRCVGLQWNVRYSDMVSNTHDAPLSGITNFGSREGRPIGYPGWAGRVWVRYAKYPKSFGSEPFQRTLTYTGTGGFGSYHGPWERIARHHYQERTMKRQKINYPEPAIFSWDYRFFADDWPAISMWSILSDNKITEHRYHWVDSEVWQLDQEFIQGCTVEA
jgi:hypothetical protein